MYAAQKEKDKGMSNITLRTIAGIPVNFRNDTKIIFLQVARACSLFNASHKVNFEKDEVPKRYGDIELIPSKVKNSFTFARPAAFLYKKTSLTFDYWMPKFLEWTSEVRSRKLKSWKGNAILEHESCTDFMRICPLFLSDPQHCPPIAKAEDRESILKLNGMDFTWTKKSAKREDILNNNKKLNDTLKQISSAADISIPLEAWCRLMQTSFIKSIIK